MPICEDHAQKDAYRTEVGPSNRPLFGRRRERKLICFAFPVKVLPPLFVSYDSVESLIASLPEATRTAHEFEIRRVTSLGLPPAVSLRTLAALFGVSAEFIGAISRAPSRYYRVFKIRKGKKTRLIQAPKVALKLLQTWLGHHVASAVQLPGCVYGFVPGRSGVRDAATYHCPANWVYSLDIRDFFPSIKQGQVHAALMRIGYSDTTANFLTRILTLNGSLPQGSPASPVLSNIVFRTTDEQLTALATELGIRYTRYADDLVFSGNTAPPPGLRKRVWSIVSDAGWVIAEEKERLAQLPARLKVHGLLVHGDRPRLTKGYRNRIRAYKYLLSTNKVCVADMPKIRGHIAYSQFIDKQ